MCLLRSFFQEHTKDHADGSPNWWMGPEPHHSEGLTLPTSDAEPHSIAVGPDGALWFTEFSGNKIGRISTDGVDK